MTKTLKVQVDDEVHRRFKSACAAAGQSMREVLVELAVAYADGAEEGKDEGKAADRRLGRRGGRDR